MVLTASTVAVTLLYRQARDQARSAEQRRGQAEAAGRRAAAAQRFLGAVVASVNPQTAQGREPADVFAEMLDLAAARLDEEFADQPDVAAELRLALGQAYDQLGRAAVARPLLESALTGLSAPGASGDARIADCRQALGQALLNLGELDPALELLDSKTANAAPATTRRPFRSRSPSPDAAW